MQRHRLRSIGLVSVLVIALVLIGVQIAGIPTEPPPATPRQSANAVVAVATEAATNPSTSAPQANSRDAASTGAAAAAQAAATGNAEPPLPADGTPLLEFASDLDRRARRGDAKAACRLAAEMTRCDMVKSMITGPRGDAIVTGMLAQRNISEAERERRIREHLTQATAAERIKKICLGIDSLPLLSPARYFAIPALHGHPESAVRFLRSTRSSDLLRDPELYQLFREHGFALFLQGIERGDAQMVRLWAQSLSWFPTALNGVLPEEWRRPQAAQALSARIDHVALGQDLRQVDATAAEQEIAWRQANDLFERHFEHSDWFAAQSQRWRAEQSSGVHPTVRGLSLDAFDCDRL